MGIRSAVVAGLVMVVVATGCAGSAGRTTTKRTDDRSVRDRDALVLAAVIEHLGPGVSSTGAPTFVLDHLVANVGEPEPAGRPSGTPYSRAFRAAISEALPDGVTLRFVASRDDAIEGAGGRQRCQVVADGGVLVTLGPVEEVGERGGRHVRKVTVEYERYVACLGAEWGTFVVEQQGGTWKVTGNTGPIAVA